jgi:hypothetical protein
MSEQWCFGPCGLRRNISAGSARSISTESRGTVSDFSKSPRFSRRDAPRQVGEGRRPQASALPRPVWPTESLPRRGSDSVRRDCRPLASTRRAGSESGGPYGALPEGTGAVPLADQVGAGGGDWRLGQPGWLWSGSAHRATEGTGTMGYWGTGVVAVCWVVWRCGGRFFPRHSHGSTCPAGRRRPVRWRSSTGR